MSELFINLAERMVDEPSKLNAGIALLVTGGAIALGWAVNRLSKKLNRSNNQENNQEIRRTFEILGAPPEMHTGTDGDL